MAKPNMRERIAAAFREGEPYLTKYELALRIWPQDENPRAWRYAVQGGPPGWVRTLGAAIKHHGLSHGWDRHGSAIVYRPRPSKAGD